MQKILVSILLMGLLSTMAAAKGNTKAGAKTAAAKVQSWSGWVSDEKCKTHIDAACSKRCQAEGVKLVFVNETDKAIIPVANQDALKAFAGQHVKVQGKLDNGSLTVSNVKPVAEAAGGK
jgi:hypothetical protein